MQAAAAARQAAAETEARSVAAALPAATAAAGTFSKAATTAAAASDAPATPVAHLAADSAASPGAEAAAAGAAAPASTSRPQAKALGVFGRVWDFLIDEASYVEAAEGAPSVFQGVVEWGVGLTELIVGRRRLGG